MDIGPYIGILGGMETAEDAVALVGWTLDYKSLVAGEKVADEAIGQFPESADCWAMVALTKLWRGKLEEAQSAMSLALGRGADSPVVKAIAGEIETYLGNKKEGLAFIDEARREAPEHWTVLRQAGIYGLNSQADLARQMHLRRIELDPENPGALSSFCSHLMTRNELGELEAFLDGTPASYKTKCGYFRNRASIAIKKRDTETAERYLRQAVAADPESALAWAVLSSLLVNSGRIQEGIDAAHYSLEINSRSTTAYQALATASRIKGDKASQARYEQKAKEAVPGLTGNPNYRQATQAMRDGKGKKGIALLSIEPANELPLHRGMRLRFLAEALRREKDFVKLEPVIAALEADHNSSEEFYGAKSALLSHQGKAAEALIALDNGIKELGYSIYLLADRVTILKALGRTKEADETAEYLITQPIGSSLKAIHAIVKLSEAGYGDHAKTLLTRAERETPSVEFKKIRWFIDLKDRPDAVNYLAKRILQKQGIWGVMKMTFFVLWKKLSKK